MAKPREAVPIQTVQLQAHIQLDWRPARGAAGLLAARASPAGSNDQLPRRSFKSPNLLGRPPNVLLMETIKIIDWTIAGPWLRSTRVPTGASDPRREDLAPRASRRGPVRK